MRTVVFDSHIIEQEVKPHSKLGKFREMLGREVQEKLADSENLRQCGCPACASENGDTAFERFNLTYLQCRRCNSLYISPRPSDAAIIEFYRHSNAWKFWRDYILPETREIRRNNIYNPRARWLLDVCDEYRPDARCCVAVGYHSDLLIQELYRLEPDIFPITVTNPIADVEWMNIDIPGVSIRSCAAIDFQDIQSMDVILAFDFLDRCADVHDFFNNAWHALNSGGLLVAGTTLTGFDVWVLWEQSENVYPPDRLNLFSIEGLKELTQSHGFEILELSTPGMFDTESVHRAVSSNPDFDWPRFIRYMFENRGESAFRGFQEFLQKYRMSSFGRIALRKVE